METRVYRLFDLESVLDPAMGPPVSRTGEPYKFPPAPCWAVVCAASILLEESEGEGRKSTWKIVRADVLVGTDESRIITVLASSQHRYSPTIVSFNGRHFDMPVVVARAMRHRVPFDWYFRTPGPRKRYSEDGTIDLAEELSDYGAAPPTSLDAWSRLVGGPAKSAKGDQVAEMWEAGEIERIASYCFDDVLALGCVFIRWLHTKGRISTPDEARLRDELVATVPTMNRLDPRPPQEALSV